VAGIGPRAAPGTGPAGSVVRCSLMACSYVSASGVGPG
jgi:hypothetical protein